MRCPHCRQQTTPTAEGLCGLCGSPCPPAASPVRSLYVVTSGFALSTLAYAALVFIMEQTQGAIAPTQPAFVRETLPYVLLALSAVAFVLGQRVAARLTPARPLGALVVECAVAEAACVYGLLIYFLARSIEWFVLFLGLSWLMFLYTSLKLPGYAAVLETSASAPPE